MGVQQRLDGCGCRPDDEVALNRLGNVFGAVGTRTLEGGWKEEGKAVCGAFRVDTNGDVWYGVAPNTDGMEKQYFFCARFFPHCNALVDDEPMIDRVAHKRGAYTHAYFLPAVEKGLVARIGLALMLTFK